MIEVNGMAHVILTVSQWEKARAFYAELLPFLGGKGCLIEHGFSMRDDRGEAMALNDSYLNPQLGRIVRTLGFDREWVRGEGAHLLNAFASLPGGCAQERFGVLEHRLQIIH